MGRGMTQRELALPYGPRGHGDKLAEPLERGVGSAVLSDDGLYRYELRRTWRRHEHTSYALFVMLNPSTADATEDDHTIRRCRHFARAFGSDGLIVVNLYAYRATDPRELAKAEARGIDIVGPENEDYLVRAAEECVIRVVAWGKPPIGLAGRTGRALHLLRTTGWAGLDIPGKVHCLGKTQEGHPRHPSRLSNAAELVEL